MLKGEKERRKVCEGILKVCESDKKFFESVRKWHFEQAAADMFESRNRGEVKSEKLGGCIKVKVGGCKI